MATGSLRQVGTQGQKSATRTLAKFCRQHGHAPAWVARLEQFGEALDDRDVPQLQQLIAIIRRAGMGSFHDWFPEVAFPHEDAEYVEPLWNALYGHWFEQVAPIIKVQSS
jgi:hypothetical protein